ncbi:hypothetical protein RJT34_17420 [Clitoria ternatea]|uniref:Uncharacterized protein n=1 Tax=Clitoria ternatea TaxID=43366 RepID=A0AAN9PDS3_CLITE
MWVGSGLGFGWLLLRVGFGVRLEVGFGVWLWRLLEVGFGVRVCFQGREGKGRGLLGFRVGVGVRIREGGDGLWWLGGGLWKSGLGWAVWGGVGLGRVGVVVGYEWWWRLEDGGEGGLDGR